MTDTSLTFLHNDDGEIDRKRVERIRRLEAALAHSEEENAELREIVSAVAECEAREIVVHGETIPDVALFHDETNVLYIRERARDAIAQWST